MKINLNTTLVLSLLFGLNFGLAQDCPADSSYHVDSRTQISDGIGGMIENPTFGDTIATGLCACIDFKATLDGNENSVTLTVFITDHEPVRGVEINIYNDQSTLISNNMSEPFVDADGDNSYDSGEDFTDWDGNGNWTSQLYSKGSKLTNLENEDGTSASSSAMQLIANDMGGYIKIMAYNTSQVQTQGDGTQGELFSITFGLPSGQVALPDNISFGMGMPNVPGTTNENSLLNVVCSYPDTNNMTSFSSDFLSIAELGGIPNTFALDQNYPNPFNPTTLISFDLPQFQHDVKLTVYNLLGHRVAELYNGSANPGRFQVEWNGLDSYGQTVASGMYFYELKTGEFTARKKMILLR
ncbi:MAG: T9SS type A sorting domain-containing protein [Candidatus Marinimicrobia bacterium]|jgi:flagellar hook assembly protein FlgD|nr:T9SS type A sorting domain-containing protein [Candidatus Neomarinimicrobiota bacterium]MBT3618780.1 T9SS type A sorting domain-containing protein [Candidatus Neomarinimicrobiota bacterium]MBT3829473.1 T9SS type A sorting domain-containing protein [Candidatus Neomarinimicrobiota bacterium]MBT3996679.1 T9SS type A sorting domain-containing protein [Candidatus Neomarinimicrobiota bacterium]MBT4281071.1 T9SS type A sorting domain-containing protein [Candidatus Neomarinimicrobiota bacterium]